MTTKVVWAEPTVNVDGSPVVASEITGYQLGVRPASGTVGVYPALTPVSGAGTLTEAFSSISALLVPGSYFAAIQTIGPTDSAFSAEVAVTIAAPVPVAPTGFGVA
jgi:hypothetical protein